MEDVISSAWRTAIKALAMASGYEIRRATPTYLPYDAQKLLVTKPAPVIMDVGANVGSVSQIYRRLFPLAEIYAFEPSPDAFAKLAGLAESDDHMSPFQVALSDKRGELTLHVNASQATNSLLPTEPEIATYWGGGVIGAPALATQGQIAIKAETLDLFCDEHGIEGIDILKIDAQGSELGVLRGAEGLFQRGAVGLVFLEILTAPTYVSQPQLSQYFSFFERHNMALYNVFDIAHRGEGRLVQFDAIFIAQKT